jgi:hypothetical protein
MRQVTDHAPRVTQRDGNAPLVVGAVLCAAVVAAIFTLHGGPDLLGGKFPTVAEIGTSTP